MENNDKLLDQFFTDQRKEIADNGFTRRVMRRLPNRSNRLSQIWTACCFSLALALFVIFDGLQFILGTLREIVHTAMESSVTQMDPKSLIIALIVLMYIGYRKISTLA